MQRKKVESDQECGQEIQEVGEQKIMEAETSRWHQILGLLEDIDDDDLDMVEEARQNAEAVAGTLKGKSGCEDGSSDMICVLRPEDIDIDYTNDLSDVKSFEDDSVDFHDMSDEEDQINEDMQMKMKQLVKSLEDMF